MAMQPLLSLDKLWLGHSRSWRFHTLPPAPCPHAGLPVSGAEQADKAAQMANGGGPIPSDGLIAELAQPNK